MVFAASVLLPPDGKGIDVRLLGSILKCSDTIGSVFTI